MRRAQDPVNGFRAQGEWVALPGFASVAGQPLLYGLGGPEWRRATHPVRTSSRRSSTRITASGRFGGRVHTRFPPEPNGYLHIGHAKSICLNFGLAAGVRRQVQPALRRHQPDQGRAGVRRFDHATTSAGSASTGRTALFYASDYFEQLYDWAVQLIKDGKAYVCDLTGRRDPRVPRHAHRAGQEQPVPRPLGRGEPRPVRAHAGGRVPRRRAHAAREDRHGLAEPQPARPGDVPHPARARITAPATSGASTRCTTARTASPTRSRASRTRSARWSSRTTGRCTTGSSTRSASTTRSRSSSPGSTSRTR